MKALWMILTLASASAQAGGIVGNGGQSILCTADAANRFNGYYHRDYLLGEAAQGNFSDAALRPVSNWADSSEQIGAVIARYLPELSASFENFRHFVFAKPDGSSINGRIRWWVAIDEEFPVPVDLADYGVPANFPGNCLQQMERDITVGGIPVHTTVSVVFPHKTVDRTVLIDQPDTKLTLYRYVPSLIRRLDPMNLSFLLLHEWLWDLTQDPVVNQRVNWFLHSKDFTSMGQDQIRNELRELGLNLPSAKKRF
jgi:hypothetical protein